MSGLIGLKVDVETLAGTRDGVPRLAALLGRYRAGATFFFCVGPDRTGRAVPRMLRPRSLARAWHASLARHYGPRTLMNGLLVPGPDIGRACGDVMRTVRDAGFEVGLHGGDAQAWRAHAGIATPEWTTRRLEQACNRFVDIFGHPPPAHAAVGWQMNRQAFRLTQRYGFTYASDTRGRFPYRPVCDAEPIECPQVPTTLPVLDEVMSSPRIAASGAVARVLAASADLRPTGHVYTLRAEMEGGRLLHAFEDLLRRWLDQGLRPVGLGALLDDAREWGLPRHGVLHAPLAGSCGPVALQGEAFAP